MAKQEEQKQDVSSIHKSKKCIHRVVTFPACSLGCGMPCCDAIRHQHKF